MKQPFMQSTAPGRKFAALIYATCIAGTAFPNICRAQEALPVETSTKGKQILRPEFFASFGPVTALDMVQRIPGFSIDGGDGRRGFGENASNVLINGDRPSTKSDDISIVLSRIPASDVDYIELIEQAGGSTQARGKAQIVNVVRKISARLSGTYSANMLIGTRYGVTPFVSGSASVQHGPTQYELNISTYSERKRGFGPEDFRDGSGRLFEQRRYVGRGGYEEASIGGAVKTKAGDIKININGKFTLNNGKDRRLGDYRDPAGIFVGTEKLFTDAPIKNIAFEIGGDIEFPLSAKLKTKLIGLYRSNNESVNASIETARIGQPVSLFETRSRNRPTEAVFRLQNDWSAAANHNIQFGTEIAYNQLDAKFSAASSTGGALTAFPASNVLVQETRIEPFISDTWSLSPAWKIEGSAIAEFSTLKLSGDSNAKRSFQFIKPRLTATWTVNKTTTLELRAERQVAQLDFGDFATSVDLGQGNQVDAGNQDLVPEKTNTFAALIRHKFLERGSIQFEASYVDVADTQDLVLITTRDGAGNVVDRFDGSGNIGRSKRWNAELTFTLPLDSITAPIGLTGLEFSYTGHYHDSRLTDPVTGVKRRTSYRPLWHQDWTLRQDIKGTGIVWGISWRERATGNAYFFNQYRRETFGSNVTAFFEYNKFKLGTLRVDVQDLLGDKLYRDRFFYDDTRASNRLTQIINRKRTTDPRILISLSGKF
jgi:Outer membrane protein beta-barrel family